MSETKGLTGWLDPKGVFHPCEYGEHRYFAEEIIGDYPFTSYDRLRDEKFYIPMGTNFNDDGYVFLSIDKDKLEPIITDEQKKWFDENFKRLDKGQQRMVGDWLYDD